MKIKIGDELIEVPRFIAKQAVGINRPLFNRFVSHLLQAQANKTRKTILDEYYSTIKPDFEETLKSMEDALRDFTRIRGLGQ